jgi:imidazolonepropionase
VELVCQGMIPAVAGERLAAFCDVFCDREAFTPEQASRVLQAGKAWSLAPKIRADKFSNQGGAELAVRMGTASADHLLWVSEAGIVSLAGSDTVAVLLPGTALFLGLPFAPARRMIEAGVAVVLGADDYRDLMMAFGTNLVACVVKAGRVGTGAR